MQQLAIVANCRNAWPDPEEIDALGITGIRTIVYDDDELERALDATPKHVRIVAMLNNEHNGVRGDWSGWRSAITSFAKRFEGRVHAVECGNELDLWGLPPEKGAHLVREAFLPLANHGIATVMGGVAGSDWANWLQRACDLSRGSFDAVALHPYGKRPNGWKDATWGFGLLGEAIQAAHTIAGTPVYLTEWGVKVGDAGGAAGQADYLEKGILTIRAVGPKIVPFAAYFCWADKIGTEHERDNYNAFGLRDMSMKARIAWSVYRDRMSDPEEPSKPEEPPKPMKTTYTLDEVREIRWKAIVPQAKYHAEFGFESYWRDHPELGSPLTADELTLDTGEACRPFANGIAIWKGDRVEVVG